MNLVDARAFVDEAIDALALEAYRSSDGENWSAVSPIEATIAINLERVDCAIGPRGESMFAKIGENIKQAMVALHAAKAALQPDTQP